MDRNSLSEYFLETQKALMELVELDNPSVDLKARIETIDGKDLTFTVISTSAKVRIEKMIEEKIFIKTKKGEIEGTVVDAYSSTIVVRFNSKVKEKEGSSIVLRTQSNYNNEVILKAAENFFKSEKLIHDAIYDCFSGSTLTDHKIINKNYSEGKLVEQQSRAVTCDSDTGIIDTNNIIKDCDKKTSYINPDRVQFDVTSATNECCKGNLKSLIINGELGKNCNATVGADIESIGLSSLSKIKLNAFNESGGNKTQNQKCVKDPYDFSKMSNLLDDKKLNFLNKNLNESQQLCVNVSMLDVPYKILGPPGTGKTETVVEIISQALLDKKSILVCGPSNISIDNIISRFIQSPYYLEHNTKFYRLGSSFKGLVKFNIEKMASDAVSFMKKEDDDPHFGKELVQRKLEFTREYKKDCKLVFSTLFSSLKENHFFDLCIVDEACQGTLLECFLAVVKAKNFILVGDPNQLCPASTSLYEHLDLPTIILNEQYRMPKDLMEFSNGHFYGNQIISNKMEEFFFTNQSRILFIDTSYFSYIEEDVDQSKINQKEAFIVQSAVEWLAKKGFDDIGIITPYSAQVRLLRDLTNVQVETVDGFQGQEKDFIILSLVRSNDEGEIGFLRDKKRLNVAITRAKKGLIVIADSSNFTKDKFFRQFFKFLNSNSEVMDPETFLNSFNI